MTNLLMLKHSYVLKMNGISVVNMENLKQKLYKVTKEPTIEILMIYFSTEADFSYGKIFS